MAVQQQNPQHPTTAVKAVKWSFFLALNWRLSHLIVAAARLAYGYLTTAGPGQGEQHDTMPVVCECIC